MVVIYNCLLVSVQPRYSSSFPAENMKALLLDVYIQVINSAENQELKYQ